jgi:hypothetical protein
MTWLIIRTDAHKEQFVARQVAGLGFDAWVPCQLVTSRPQIARRVTAKAHITAVKELPILPRRIFASVPRWALWQGELDGIRHLVGMERDGDQRLLEIPDSQIAAFKTKVDEENTAALALAARPSRRQKAKWRSLHDALIDLIEQAKTQFDVAA